MRVSYTLVKHPSLPVTRKSKGKRVDYATTLPLECFVEEWSDDEENEVHEEQPEDDELTVLDYFDGPTD